MNKQLKILLTITAASVVFVAAMFFVALDDYNYDVLVTLKNFWIMFLFPVFFVLLFLQQKRIFEAPIKEIRVEIVNKQIVYSNLKNKHFYYTTFKTSTGLLWSFDVPVEIFNKSTIGQHGILSYRERKSRLYFVFFTSTDNIY